MKNFKFTEEIETFRKENDNKLKDITFDDLFTYELLYQIKEKFEENEIQDSAIDNFNKNFTIDKIRETAHNILCNDTLWELVNEEISALFNNCLTKEEEEI